MSKIGLLSRTTVALSVAAAFSMPTVALANTAPVVQAQDVMVTATRSEKALADVNMSVSVVTSEDIARAGYTKSIADLLETTVPGLRVRNDGSQGLDRITMRGEDAFRTLVMVNGQRITEQKSMSGAPVLIDPSQVERIEVIRGPASVLYGSDAIGGAVNIITKKGADKPVSATVSAGFDGAADGKDGSASISGSSNGWNWRLGVAGKDYGLLDTPIGKAEHTEFKSKSADAFLSYDIDPDKTIGLTLSHYDLDFWTGDQSVPADDFWVHVPEWKRTRGAIFGEFKNISDTLSRVRIDLSQERNAKKMDNHVRTIMNPMDVMGQIIPGFKPDSMRPPSNHPGAQGGHTSAHPGSRVANWKPGHGQGDLGNMGNINQDAPVVVDNFTDNTTDTTALSIQTDWSIGDSHFLIAGYELAYDQLKAKSISNIAPQGMPKPISPSNKYDGEQTRHAIFASMESTIAEDWVANYGVRYTWVKSEMDIHKAPMSVMGMPIPGSSTTVDNSEGKAVFNAGLSYNGFDNLSLRANFSQGYRAPILQELFIDSLMGGRFTYANPDLKPETSDNFELGARYHNGSLMVDAAVFYSEADNYITAIDQGKGTPVFKYDNIAQAKTLGFEMASSLRMGDFEPYTTVTLMSREYENNGISSKKTGTPKASARVGLRYFTTAMNADWNADFYVVTQTKSEEWDFENDKLMSRYGGFTTYNLTGGVAFGPGKAYRLDAGIYNIGDKLYRYNGGKMDNFDRTVYEPGRHAAVKFTATF